MPPRVLGQRLENCCPLTRVSITEDIQEVLRRCHQKFGLALSVMELSTKVRQSQISQYGSPEVWRATTMYMWMC